MAAVNRLSWWLRWQLPEPAVHDVRHPGGSADSRRPSAVVSQFGKQARYRIAPATRPGAARPPRHSGDADNVWTAKEDSVALPKHLEYRFRHSVGLAWWWRFSFDLLWVVNGVVFYLLLFSTGEWKRLVPNSFDVFPNAVSTALQYPSLQLPENAGFSTYNALQLLATSSPCSSPAPVALITGLLQAPAIAGRFGTGAGLFNRQVARTLHFGVLVWMLTFIAVHTAMIFPTGFVGNVNHMTLGTDTNSWAGVALYVAWMAVVVAFWLAASPLTIRHLQSDPASRPIPGRRAPRPRSRRPIRLPSTGIWTSRRTSGPTENARSPRRTHGSRPAAGPDSPHDGPAAGGESRRGSPTLGCSPCRSGNRSPVAFCIPGLVGNRQMGRRRADAASASWCGRRTNARWWCSIRSPRGRWGRYDCHPIASMSHEQTITRPPMR